MAQSQYPVQNTYYNFVNMHTYMKQCMLGEWNWEYITYFRDFMDIKTSMFYYDNLPDGLTSQIMETALLLYNNLCLYKPKGLGKLVLGYYIWTGDVDLYWKPTKVNIMSFNGKELAHDIPFEDIVLVRDNVCDIIPFLTLNTWIEKLYEVDKTISTVLKWVRFPKILEGSKEEVPTIKKVIEKGYNFEPIVITRKGFTKDVFPDHDLNLPVQLMELYDLREKYRGLALGSIGIYNVTEKRERDVAAVTAVNVDYQNFVYQEMYKERQRFIEDCNKKFGTNITLSEAYVENRQEDADLKAYEEGQVAEATDIPEKKDGVTNYE